MPKILLSFVFYPLYTRITEKASSSEIKRYPSNQTNFSRRERIMARSMPCETTCTAYNTCIFLDIRHENSPATDVFIKTSKIKKSIVRKILSRSILSCGARFGKRREIQKTNRGHRAQFVSRSFSSAAYSGGETEGGEGKSSYPSFISLASEILEARDF